MAEARVRGSRAVIAVADARIRGGRGAGSRLARARGSQREAEFAVGVGAARCGSGFAAWRGVRGRGRSTGFAGAGSVQGSRRGRGAEFVVGVGAARCRFRGRDPVAARFRVRTWISGTAEGTARWGRDRGTARWGRGRPWGHGRRLGRSWRGNRAA